MNWIISLKFAVATQPIEKYNGCPYQVCGSTAYEIYQTKHKLVISVLAIIQ